MALSERGIKIAATRLRISVGEYQRHLSADEHWCPFCSQWKPRDAFYTNRHIVRGVTGYCRACTKEIGRLRHAPQPAVPHGQQTAASD